MTYVPVIMGAEGRKHTLPKQIDQKLTDQASPVADYRVKYKNLLTIDE